LVHWQASKTRVGIGAYFQRSEALPDALEVKSILANSPAHACKLVSVGDFIIAVDGELVGGKSLSQLAEKVCVRVFVCVFACADEECVLLAHSACQCLRASQRLRAYVFDS